MKPEEDVPEEVDFSGGERGRFYRKGATLQIPVYLEPDVLAYFIAKADELGVTTDSLLNDVLRRAMKEQQKKPSG